MILSNSHSPRRFHRFRRAAFLLALLPGILHGHGTSHELIEAASRQIAAQPDNAALYLRRAALHLEHGDWLACLRDADEAERRQTDDLGVGLLRGRALAASGQYAEAKVVLDSFVAEHPTHAAGWMERARVRGALGMKAEAADDFTRGLSLVPQPEPDHVFELAAFLCRAGREEKAIATLDAALRSTPGQPALLERAVQIETGLGHFDAALRRLDRAIGSAAVKEPLMARRAAVLAQAGRIRESASAWRELHASLAALPPAERGSHAMSVLARQTRDALTALGGIAP